jgi:hypothetical protein
LSASLNDISFFFFFFCVGDSWGGLIAIVLLAVGGFVVGCAGGIVDGGVGDGPLPRGIVGGIGGGGVGDGPLPPG